MDYEYDGEEPYESRVLWGRVGVYLGSLLLAFVLGTCAGGGADISEGEVAELRRSVADLTQRNVELEQTIAAVGASPEDRPRISTTEDPTEPVEGDGAGEGDGDGDGDGDAATEGDAGDGDAGDAGETRTYEVQSGDTLTAIAQRMYGDSTRFDLIAEANDLEGQLVVGQELIIPPAN